MEEIKYMAFITGTHPKFKLNRDFQCSRSIDEILQVYPNMTDKGLIEIRYDGERYSEFVLVANSERYEIDEDTAMSIARELDKMNESDEFAWSEADYSVFLHYVEEEKERKRAEAEAEKQAKEEEERREKEEEVKRQIRKEFRKRINNSKTDEEKIAAIKEYAKKVGEDEDWVEDAIFRLV